MKKYQPNNIESIVTMVVLILLLVEQILWKVYHPTSGVATMGAVLFLNIYGIFKAKSDWNSYYLIDDDKITYVYNSGREQKTMYWSSIVKAKAFGWKYFPLAFKGFVIEDGNSTVTIRVTGLKEYREVWLFAYDKIREKSPAVITNNSLDKTINKIKSEINKGTK